MRIASPSSRGLGHHPFTVATGVRIPVGTPILENPGFGRGFSLPGIQALISEAPIHPDRRRRGGREAELCIQPVRFTIGQQADVRRRRQAGPHPVVQPPHHLLAQALPLQAWQHGDVADLQVAAVIADDAPHRYQLIALVGAYAEQGIGQCARSGFLMLGTEACQYTQPAVVLDRGHGFAELAGGGFIHAASPDGSGYPAASTSQPLRPTPAEFACAIPP
ncbi:hypothetical protein G6F65_013425 [Rhizopus arrhizus]|nr:hypothetical protein G6F65_013425 [Rhizopus arrhizus]